MNPDPGGENVGRDAVARDLGAEVVRRGDRPRTRRWGVHVGNIDNRRMVAKWGDDATPNVTKFPHGTFWPPEA